MKNFIKKKRVLITGATSGIGEACAKNLLAYDVELVLVARDEEKLQMLQNKLQSKKNITILSLDVRKQKEVTKKLSDLDIDILINSAGLALGFEAIDEGNSLQWDEMIDTNIKGLLYVTKILIPKMKKKESAHIVNIGSVAGKIAYPNGAVYCATKAAVHSLGESINADLYATNVKMTTIAPGAVKTNFSNIRFGGDHTKAEAVYNGFEPLVAEDIADAIVSVLNTPKHVNIQYMDIMPTAQRNPYLIYKEVK